MSELKDLVKKETLLAGSLGAMPSSQVVVLKDEHEFDSTGSGRFTYIAPCSGRLVVFLQAETHSYSDATVAGCTIRDGYGVRRAVRTTDGSVECAVRKGENYEIDYYDTGRVHQWLVKLIKNYGDVMGGGKPFKTIVPQYIRRVLLCLKISSETLRKLEAGSRSRLNVASSSRVSRPQLSKEIASTCHLKTAYASFGLRVPMSMPRFAKMEVYKLSRQTATQRGQKPLFLVPVGKRSTMRYGVRSSKVSSTSFLLSVACNNARMEVAA